MQIEAIATSTQYSSPGAPHMPESTLLNMSLTAGMNQAGPSTQASQAAAQDAISAAVKKMTKQERTKTLQQLVEDGWLSSSAQEDGYYCIGVSRVSEQCWWVMQTCCFQHPHLHY